MLFVLGGFVCETPVIYMYRGAQIYIYTADDYLLCPKCITTFNAEKTNHISQVAVKLLSEIIIYT